jgi:hypothetical protein
MQIPCRSQDPDPPVERVRTHPLMLDASSRIVAVGGLPLYHAGAAVFRNQAQAACGRQGGR